MNEPDDLLKFLVDGLSTRQRDLVTKAFYKFAEGDPNSSPVNEAILLTAVSRRLTLAPQEFREANAEFGRLLEKGRELEARIRERVELSNAGVVASFKDEATRAASTLRASSQNNESIVYEGRKMVEVMRDSRTQSELLFSELRHIRAELKANRETNEKTAEATENTKASMLTIKEIVSRITHVFAISWIAIGVGIGFIGLVGTCLTRTCHWYVAGIGQVLMEFYEGTRQGAKGSQYIGLGFKQIEFSASSVQQGEKWRRATPFRCGASLAAASGPVGW